MCGVFTTPDERMSSLVAVRVWVLICVRSRVGVDYKLEPKLQLYGLPFPSWSAIAISASLTNSIRRIDSVFEHIEEPDKPWLSCSSRRPRLSTASSL